MHKIGDKLKLIDDNIIVHLQSERFKMDNIIGSDFFESGSMFYISRIETDEVFLFNNGIYFTRYEDIDYFFTNIKELRRSKLERIFNK